MYSKEQEDKLKNHKFNPNDSFVNRMFFKKEEEEKPVKINYKKCKFCDKRIVSDYDFCSTYHKKKFEKQD